MEKTKLTDEEVKKLLRIQEISNNLTLEFGYLKRQYFELEKKEDLLKNSLKSLEKENLNLLQELEDKYGKGSIDIQTGEFIPLE